MKVARFSAPANIRFKDTDEPLASVGEVVIRVRNCWTCATDVRTSTSGPPIMTAREVTGHEIVREITGIGVGTDGCSVGDRVQVIAVTPDGTCDDWLAGHPTD